jgi:hypothetical protein
MEFNLEFRSKEGKYLFGLKKIRKIEGKGEFVTLECIKLCGYLLGKTIDVVMEPGDYIKAYNE